MNKLADREKGRRWVYLLCAVPTAYIGLLASHDELAATLPYVVVLAVCAVQFVRPTFAGWFLLVLVFWSYTIAVAAHPRNGPLHEFLIVVLLFGCEVGPIRPDERMKLGMNLELPELREVAQRFEDGPRNAGPCRPGRPALRQPIEIAIRLTHYTTSPGTKVRTA